jgi:2-polyprenyl-3-methyl-5-hydroxy-6-metoxy-1,4-benzoquinol methylase
MKALSFYDFFHIGSDLWRVQHNPLAALFMRLMGPLGTHARIRNTRVLNNITSLDLDQGHILDIGCGHGYALFWLARRCPGARLEGVEIDPIQVAECQRAADAIGYTQLKFRQGTFQDISDSGSYDLIITIDVLEHVPDDTGMLRKIANLLRPGGTVVIHVPLRHQLQRRIFSIYGKHTVDDHVRDEYLPDEIRAKVEQAGLTVVKLEYGFGTWGELSFELNNLFWTNRALRTITALLTLPPALISGYIDTVTRPARGNSILIVAMHPG